MRRREKNSRARNVKKDRSAEAVPERRAALKWIAGAGAAVAAACTQAGRGEEMESQGAVDAVLGTERISGLHWKTLDPFLFCAHHHDAYPAGNERLGPAASLAGRDLGQDFGNKDGWSMYHGQVVPGFPQHPHRGFETVTIARQGLIDHADSLGATARYGQGDVQWLTAGRGINHSEMFPLLRTDQPNPTELFQVWLNLPRASKLADPNFSMFWAQDIPRHRATDEKGRATEVTIVAGELAAKQALAPPPDSWAARSDANVAIWTIKMEPGARWTMPATLAGTNRRLYFFLGASLRVAGHELQGAHFVDLHAERQVQLENGPEAAELLLLQGRPIGEPVAQYGPFVMNSQEEIRQTLAEYRQSRFGGWPWDSEAPVLPREEGRFAKLIDGRLVRPS